ncbi:hypothetical protein ACOV1W_16460 [Paraclostridium bifermentans]|uniref:hypothetical protein n=1 Tax=Paraclostridium bifermentans TaxID=1490 RepID=UPI003D2D94BA
MNIYMYHCDECKNEEILNYDDLDCPELCPECNNPIALFTDIESETENYYRVLISKKVQDLEEDDLLFTRYDNKSYRVFGIRNTTKNRKPAISVNLEGFGSKTYLKDEIVYCADGVWDGNEK